MISQCSSIVRNVRQIDFDFIFLLSFQKKTDHMNQMTYSRYDDTNARNAQTTLSIFCELTIHYRHCRYKVRVILYCVCQSEAARACVYCAVYTVEHTNT